MGSKLIRNRIVILRFHKIFPCHKMTEKIHLSPWLTDTFIIYMYYMRLQKDFDPILRHRTSGYLALVRIFQNRFSFSQSFSFWGKSEAKLVGSSSQVRARLVVFGMLRTKINDALRKLIRKETGRLQWSSGCKPRTTDTQWRHKSKIPEKLGRCGRQNMLRLNLKIAGFLSQHSIQKLCDNVLKAFKSKYGTWKWLLYVYRVVWFKQDFCSSQQLALIEKLL